jgi:hypothetical protein
LLEFAWAEYESVRGKIISDWKIKGGCVYSRVVVPTGAEARVILPQKNGAKPEGAVQKPGETGKETFRTGADSYNFQLRQFALPSKPPVSKRQ